MIWMTECLLKDIWKSLVNSKLIAIIGGFVLLYRITTFAQEQSKIGFDFFFTNGYQSQNDNFLLKSGEEWKDYLSSLGGDVAFTGGKFSESQYELSLRYTTSYSQLHSSKITLIQLYIQTPLTDYTFLTVGKRIKEFGLAEFHNFSNRLSPKERLLGQLEKLERQAPGLIQFDWIISPDISLGTFLWSYNAQKWEDINIGTQTEVDLDKVYCGIYLYYEKLKNWLIGVNISDQIGNFRLYSEGIIREKNEQYFNELLGFKNKGIQFAFSNGLAWEWKYYSARFEYAFRTEGYNKREGDEIENIIKSRDEGLDYYNKDYFGKNYFGISLGASHLIITNLGIGLSNLISLDSKGGELDINISYIHKDKVALGVNYLFYYGKRESEYLLYLPYQSQLRGFVTFYY